jgi:hypothetical protein
MELFGTYTPRGENPIGYPLRVFSEAQHLIAMRDYKAGYDRDLGNRLAPYKDMLSHVSMAYEIIAYPKLADTQYGSATRELVRDAQAHPHREPDQHPHRAPVTLNRAEQKLLGIITAERGLPIDPQQQVYSYTDLPPRQDTNARVQELLRKGRENAIKQGILRPREEIRREMQERQTRWRQSGSQQPTPPNGKPRR